MKSILAVVRDFFKGDGIEFKRTEFSGVLQFGFMGENGYFRGYVEVDEEHKTVQVHTLAPVRVERSKVPDVAELLMRINGSLLLGHLELDMDSGTIGSRTSIVLGESGLHHDVMEQLLYANWFNMDAFFPAVNAVLFGTISPQKALDRVLRQRPDPPNEAGHDEFPSGPLGDILRDSRN
jgi:hypothetical protein